MEEKKPQRSSYILFLIDIAADLTHTSQILEAFSNSV